MRDNRLLRKKAAGKGNDQCYASGECQKTGLSETQVVFCPKCKKKHYSAYALMNEFVNCECGYSFYAFVDKGLHILIPAQETRIDQIVRAMRRFVVTTGRCQDIDPKLLEYMEEDPIVNKQERDLDAEFASLLEEYQIVVFGDCYITREVIDSIYKAFEHNADVVLKKQKDGVDISEMKKPTRVSKAKVHQGERIMKYSEMLRQTQGESEILPFSTARSHAAAQ